ncbi:hypothetical protein [Bacillus oleivorans]|nr:hypothetical protein [Bacillus oleivorans]
MATTVRQIKNSGLGAAARQKRKAEVPQFGVKAKKKSKAPRTAG